MVKNCRRQHCH